MYRCIDVKRVKGNKEKILSEEIVTGDLEFIPRSDGGGWLMLPIIALVDHNVELRKHKMIECQPLSKLDIHKRAIIDVTKNEARELLSAQPGEIVTMIRKGWGRIWNHKFQRVNNDSPVPREILKGK